MTVKIEQCHLLEIQSHLEKNIKWFAQKHANRKVKNEDCVVMLMVLKGLVSCLLASLAKTINLDKNTLLSEFTNEIKEAFLIFEEFEKTKEKLQ